VPCRDATSRSPRLPLRIGPTGRYLVDQAGAPTLVHGDTAWSIIVAATREGAVRYLDDRAAKGVNAIIVNLIEACFSPDPPRDLEGREPFTRPGDFTTPNDDYFDHAAWVVEQAAARGITVFLAPCYLGYKAPSYPGYGGRPEGWFDEVLANGVEACGTYGRYVGRRFGRFDNIVWVMSGDRCPGAALEHVRAMARGILAEDPRHLMTAHVNPECKPYEQYPDDPWLTLNQTYTYTIVHRALIEDYNSRPIRPNILFESTYENEHNSSPQQIRRQAWWALTSGACGQFLGTLPTWLFAEGWEAALDSPGSLAMVHLRAFFDSIPWWNLVPYQEHRLVVAGIGEHRGLDFASAAITGDGRVAVVYLPAPREITLDLTRLADERLAVTWFDPLTGERRDAGHHQAAGTWPFRPPWDHDAALVLESGGAR
jgi:hypothetical protein